MPLISNIVDKTTFTTIFALFANIVIKVYEISREYIILFMRNNRYFTYDDNTYLLPYHHYWFTY